MNSFDATRMYANARRSITCTRAHVHRQSGVTDITARDLVLEINTHLLYNITEVQNLVATSALATLVHFAATRFLLFGNVHASFLFISTHAVPVQLFKVTPLCPLPICNCAAVHVLSEVDEGISMKKKFKWKHRLQMKIERM